MFRILITQTCPIFSVSVPVESKHLHSNPFHYSFHILLYFSFPIFCSILGYSQSLRHTSSPYQFNTFYSISFRIYTFLLPFSSALISSDPSLLLSLLPFPLPFYYNHLSTIPIQVCRLQSHPFRFRIFLLISHRSYQIRFQLWSRRFFSYSGHSYSICSKSNHVSSVRILILSNLFPLIANPDHFFSYLVHSLSN